jgi:hypothetical protein
LPLRSAVAVFLRRQVGQYPSADLDPAATVFDVLAAVVGDFPNFVAQVFSQTVARDRVRAAKFLIAGEPAEYRGSSRHRGIGTVALRLSPLASRWQIVRAISVLYPGERPRWGSSLVCMLSRASSPRTLALTQGSEVWSHHDSWVDLKLCRPPGAGCGHPRRAPECRRSVRAGRVGCLNQGLNLPNLFSHDPTDRFGLARVEPVLEPSVALARRATGAFGATVHTTPATTPYGRLSAGATGAGLCPTSAGSGHIRQSSRNVRLTHGVVCHFSPSPSRSFPAVLTIPTTPWAPG